MPKSFFRDASVRMNLGAPSLRRCQSQGWESTILLVFAGIFFAFSQADAQSLRITAPINGAIVHPGETLLVTVDSTEKHFKLIILAGPDPIGFVPPIGSGAGQTDTPSNFSVRIPANTPCRKYTIIATGVTTAGTSVDSEQIEIDVERPDLPLKLTSISPPELYFREPGGSFPILLTGTFPDGQTLDLIESSKVTYLSLNPETAQVSNDGVVTARSPGTARVIATYTQEGRKVEAVFPVHVPVGPLASSTYSLQFGEQPVGVSSDDQHVTLTAKTLGPLRVINIETTGNFSEQDTCRDSPLKPQASCIIDVTFRPSQLGKRDGKLTIFNSFSGGPLIIPLTGTGGR
jgi:Bacterial Ig-like domain (group 2)